MVLRRDRLRCFLLPINAFFVSAKVLGEELLSNDRVLLVRRFNVFAHVRRFRPFNGVLSASMDVRYGVIAAFNSSFDDGSGRAVNASNAVGEDDYNVFRGLC